jgi:UDP-N-acetyl-D-mannosaminuronic acid dehydrogenase
MKLVELDQALAQADVVALLVNHRDFQAIDPVRLSTKVVVDTSGNLSAGG